MTDIHDMWDRHLSGACYHDPGQSKAVSALLLRAANPATFNPHLLGHLTCVAESVGCPAMMLNEALTTQGAILTDAGELDTGVVHFTRSSDVWTFTIPEAQVIERTEMLKAVLGEEYIAGQDPVRDFRTMARLLTAHVNGDTESVRALMRAIDPKFAMLAVTRQMAFTGMLSLAVERRGDSDA